MKHLFFISLLLLLIPAVGCSNPQDNSIVFESSVTEQTDTFVLETDEIQVTLTENETESETKQEDTSLLKSTDDIGLHDIDGQKQNYSFTYNNEIFHAYYSGEKWKIYDSYKIKNKDDIIIICQALKESHPIKNADMTGYRTADDMAYEWQQHNIGYELLPDDSPWKINTKDVDIDPADQGKSLYDLFADRMNLGEME